MGCSYSRSIGRKDRASVRDRGRGAVSDVNATCLVDDQVYKSHDRPTCHSLGLPLFGNTPTPPPQYSRGTRPPPSPPHSSHSPAPTPPRGFRYEPYEHPLASIITRGRRLNNGTPDPDTYPHHLAGHPVTARLAPPRPLSFRRTSSPSRGSAPGTAEETAGLVRTGDGRVGDYYETANLPALPCPARRHSPVSVTRQAAVRRKRSGDSGSG